MNEEVYKQIAAMVQAAMSGDQQAGQQIAQIMQAAELGDAQAKQLAAVIQDVASKIQQAKFGAKLNYIGSLNGKCPEGYEVEKFMSGGCVKCAKKNKKMRNGGEVKGNSVDQFKRDYKTKVRMHQNSGVIQVDPSQVYFDRRENNLQNGHLIISEEIYYPYAKGGRYLGDYPVGIAGRNIYVSPMGNDTVYWNYPETMINYPGGFMPVGVGAKDLNSAKKKFQSGVKKTTKVLGDPKAYKRARKER